jgi:hypothetical protein
MKMKKTAGRYNGPQGIERVDHDGVTHVVKPEDIEVSQQERLKWYQNGAPPEDERLLVKHKRLETSYDDGGNPMWRNEDFRTALPRPHQFSIERRLQEQREPGSTYDIFSDATKEQALANAFARVATIVIAGGVLENKHVIAISEETGLPIEEVFSLRRIADRNEELARKAAAGIPGVKDEKDPRLDKVSDPEELSVGEPVSEEIGVARMRLVRREGEELTDEELQEVGKASGLCD